MTKIIPMHSADFEPVQEVPFILSPWFQDSELALIELCKQTRNEHSGNRVL